MNSRNLDLGFDLTQRRSYADYKKQVWGKLAPVLVTMVEQEEPCPHHRTGDSFLYKNHYDKPKGICSALHYVFQLYLLRASIGFPSWEEDDPSVYRIHCPDKKGTVWEMRRNVAGRSRRHRGTRTSACNATARKPRRG